MSRKIYIEYVRQEFDKRRFELLSTEYIHAKTKLDYKCKKCSNTHSICWSDFQQERGCPYCAKNAKPTINFIRQEFNNKNLKLLSNEYINNSTKLKYLCKKCNNIHNITWSNFKQDYGCPYCANNAKLTIEFIRQEFSKKGYILISTEYINSITNLEYECKKCGSINKTSWGNFQQGKKCPTCYKNKHVGANCYNYKGNVIKLNLPLYETYAPQLEKYEQTHLIKQNELDLLGVNCLYCNKVFVPTRKAVMNRIKSINGKHKDRSHGENRLYCSESCKQACPTYGQISYPKGYAPASSREMQPQFRKMVLERDNWTCQKCGKNKDNDLETELHAHHIDPVSQNPIESCDVDNGITLCIDCHHEAHQIPGCTLNELSSCQ
jgi:hypothetical protein